MGSFLGATDLPKGWDHSCSVDRDCPEIVLIDNPVSPHPDLAGVVFTDYGILPDGPSLIVGQKQKIDVDNEFQKSEHGTHLAGIIASNDNSFGLVGVHPGVHIHSWNWNELHVQQDKLERKIYTHQRETEKRGALQIYVFASEWESSENPDRRLSDDGLANELVNEELLLVAAAGQPDPKTGELGKNLTTGYKHAPMNLGDKENILVVTECLPCEGRNPQIAPRANYSTNGIVHLAAPGEDIPSTTGSGHYAVASGTSQATAFVAGVASAMACYYPHSYKLPYQLKIRLQVTSRPLAISTGSLEEAAKVATGILDEKLAMLDPTKDWIQKNGQVIDSLEEPLLWQVRNVTGRNSKQKEVSVPLSTVYRIIQENGKAIFYIEGDEKGEVKRIGPLKLSSAELGKSLFLQRDSTCAIKNFEDLLLSSTHEVSGDAP